MTAVFARRVHVGRRCETGAADRFADRLLVGRGGLPDHRPRLDAAARARGGGRPGAWAPAPIPGYAAIGPTAGVPSAPCSTPFTPSKPFRSTRTSGEAARAFITLIRVWPPARARAPSCPARIERASAT